jgi:hypothetical protein
MNYNRHPGKHYTHKVARKTGRTRRMIEDALDLAAMGNTVFVLCSKINILDIKRKMFELCHERGYPIPGPFRFNTVDTLGIQNIDWHNQRLVGAPFKTELVIDHQVWAEQFGFVINGYHEYDDFSLLKRQPMYSEKELSAVDIIDSGLIVDFKI